MRFSHHVIFAALIILVVSGCGEAPKTDAELQDEIEKELALIKEKGELASLDDFVACDVPDEKNAFFYYEKATGAREKLQDELSEEEFYELWSLQENYTEHPEKTEYIQAFAPIYDLIDKGAHAPESCIKRDYKAEIENTETESVIYSHYRSFARMCCHRAFTHALEGETQQAARWINNSFELSRDLMGHPDFVTPMVSSVINAITNLGLQSVLQKTDLSDRELDAIAEALPSREEIDESYYLGLQGERVTYLAFLDKAYESTGEENMIVAGLDIKETVFDPEMHLAERLLLLQHYGAIIDAHNKPYFELQKEGFFDNDPVIPEKYQFCKQLEGARQIIYFLRDGNVAHADLARLALSAEKYENAHGKYPESLEEIKPYYPEEKLPVDPFTGKDYIYKKLPDGYKIYSLGLNMKDDGGIGPTPQEDIVFEVVKPDGAVSSSN